MMEEEFRVQRMTERKHTVYFAICHEMGREQDKEKWEKERA
jgi:hypothetical protein